MSSLTPLPLTPRALSWWQRWLEADEAGRRSIAQMLSTYEVQAIERLDENLGALPEPRHWLRQRGSMKTETLDQQVYERGMRGLALPYPHQSVISSLARILCGGFLHGERAWEQALRTHFPLPNGKARTDPDPEETFMPAIPTPSSNGSPSGLPVNLTCLEAQIVKWLQLQEIDFIEGTVSTEAKRLCARAVETTEGTVSQYLASIRRKVNAGIKLPEVKIEEPIRRLPSEPGPNGLPSAPAPRPMAAALTAEADAERQAELSPPVPALAEETPDDPVVVAAATPVSEDEDDLDSDPWRDEDEPTELLRQPLATVTFPVGLSVTKLEHQIILGLAQGELLTLRTLPPERRRHILALSAWVLEQLESVVHITRDGYQEAA